MNYFLLPSPLTPHLHTPRQQISLPRKARHPSPPPSPSPSPSPSHRHHRHHHHHHTVTTTISVQKPTPSHRTAPPPLLFKTSQRDNITVQRSQNEPKPSTPSIQSSHERKADITQRRCMLQQTVTLHTHTHTSTAAPPPTKLTPTNTPSRTQTKRNEQRHNTPRPTPPFKRIPQQIFEPCACNSFNKSLGRAQIPSLLFSFFAI